MNACLCFIMCYEMFRAFVMLAGLGLGQGGRGRDLPSLGALGKRIESST